jgi:hypothetical protein
MAAVRLGGGDDAAEHAADRAAVRALAGLPAAAPTSAPAALRRQTATTSSPPVAAVAGAAAALDGGGTPLPAALRAEFEPRFGRSFAGVRLHTDATAHAAAAGIGARAFTLGEDIGFARGGFDPGSARGRFTIAHELAHVAQGSDVIRRDIAEADLATTPVATIMADPDYFENGIERIEFFSAELARLHYAGGRTLDVGLVPDQIHAPFEAVDYRTTRAGQSPVTAPGTRGLGTGSIRFVPHMLDIQAPPTATMADVVAAAGRTIRFVHHPGSGRIIPTEVNALSAPRLCAALRGAEAEYVRNFDAMAQGMVQTLHTLEWVIILASFVESLGTSAAAAGTAGAARVATASEGAFARFFMRLLRAPAADVAGAQITVEGVAVGGVRVSARGGELLVTRSAIINVGRVAGQGRLIHAAFEQGAIQAARQAGMTSVRVGLETIINPAWRAYLESMGYAPELIQYGATNFTSTLTKVFTL